MRNTFDDEIGDVHERRGDRPSFTNEFLGASDSTMRHDRPPRPLDVGRRGRRLVLLIVLLAGLLGGGGYALWYWSEPISEWIASMTADWAGEDEAVGEPAAPEPEPEPEAPTEPERVFGVRGAQDGSETPPAETPPSETPPPSEPPPVEPGPGPAAVSVEASSTAVSGKVASSTIKARLAPVDTALEGCWKTAAAKPETKRSVELRLRFSIKWNGRSYGVSVTGETPESVRTCVRNALPTSGWPHPRDGGDAQVTRVWSLK